MMGVLKYGAIVITAVAGIVGLTKLVPRIKAFTKKVLSYLLKRLD